MTISNAVTSTRIFIAPLYFVLFFLPRWIGMPDLVSIIALWILFLLIEASDLADGAIARKLDQTSDIGKALDPFADSLSRLTYFFCFTIAGYMPSWVFLILLYRDLGVGFVRLMVLRKGSVMSARMSGKLKAWIYGIAGVAGLLVHTTVFVWPDTKFQSLAEIVATVSFYLAGAIAVWSLADYISVLFTRRRQES